MTPADGTAFSVGAVVALLIALWPFLFPLFLAIRRGETAPGRWLFVLSATCVSYGFMVVLFWFGAEITTYKILPYPAGGATDAASWSIPIVKFVYAWLDALFSILVIVMTYFSTRFDSDTEQTKRTIMVTAFL